MTGRSLLVVVGAIVVGLMVAVPLLEPSPPDDAKRQSHPSDLEAATTGSCPGCWVPGPTDTFQWQLSGPIDTSVDAAVYDVDLFETSDTVVQELHDLGRHVVCYVSAGSREKWRPDVGSYPARVLGRPLDGWPGERWVDIRRWGVLGPIMRARLDLCVSKGFDAVEFDNVDAYQNRSGFDLTASDQATFNTRLASEAHARGLSAALKNDVGQVALLEPVFEFAVNEECFSYDECDLLAPFITAGKAVFQVEYEMPLSAFCPEASTLGFVAQKKRWNLGVWRAPCP